VPDKLDGSEVKSIQCPHWNGKWLQGVGEHRSNHFNHRNSADQIPHRFAMRILEVVRVDTVPNLAFKKPAGYQLLIPGSAGNRSSANKCASATKLSR
jgi:hypothetical protein